MNIGCNASILGLTPIAWTGVDLIDAPRKNHAGSKRFGRRRRSATKSAAPANGLVTSYTWDARDRLLSRTVGSAPATTLTYHATGTLATLTLRTGLSLSYTYDAAHRLIGWSNNRGESGTYT